MTAPVATRTWQGDFVACLFGPVMTAFFLGSLGPYGCCLVPSKGWWRVSVKSSDVPAMA